MRCVLAFAFALSLLSAISGAQAAGKPLPPKEAIDSAKRLVAETFSAELSGADKKPAIKAMLEAASESTGVEQAALYLSAAEVAARIGDTRTAFEAIEKLARMFDVDALATKQTLLDLAAKHAKTNDVRVSVCNRGLELVDAAMAVGRMELAEAALKTAGGVSAKLRDADLRKELAAKRRELEKARKQASRAESELADARKKLDAHPDDPAANEAYGKFLCFDRNDWAAGLKHLAKSPDAGLRNLATADAKGASNGTDAAKLGDAWYAMASQSDSPREQAGYKSRAAFWYTRAVQDLKGLTKTRVEKRLKELGDAVAKAAGQSGNENGKYIDLTLAPGVLLRLVKIPASADGKVKEFWLGQTEVTQRQWMAVMGSNPSAHKGDDLPAEMITWSDCREFLNRLQSGPGGRRLSFRFPAPMEFLRCYEPIAKDQQSGPKLSKIAWVKANASDSTHSVALLEPTGFALYDMIGNVWEWSSNEDEIYGCAFSDAAPGGFVGGGAKTYNKGSNLGLRIAANLK